MFVKLIFSRKRLQENLTVYKKAEHTNKTVGITSRQTGEKRNTGEPSRARLIFGLALLPVGPEGKPFREFFRLAGSTEYSSYSSKRWQTYPIHLSFP